MADPRWKTKVSRKVEQCYRKAPFFGECWPAISGSLADATDVLDDVNFKTFLAVLQLLDAHETRVVRAGDIGPTAQIPPKDSFQSAGVWVRRRISLAKAGRTT